MLVPFGLHDAHKTGQSWPAAVNLLLSSANRLLHTQSRCFSFRLMELLQTISLPKRKHQHSWKLERLISIIEARCQQHQPQFINKNPRTEQQLHFGLACLKEKPHKPTFSSLRGPLSCSVSFSYGYRLLCERRGKKPLAICFIVTL